MYLNLLPFFFICLELTAKLYHTFLLCFLLYSSSLFAAGIMYVKQYRTFFFFCHGNSSNFTVPFFFIWSGKPCEIVSPSFFFICHGHHSQVETFLSSLFAAGTKV
jgi:hypothetical protein